MPTLTEIIQTEADQCVKCGLCLPHCPTYIKTQHEGESPRGRIALFEGLSTGQLSLTKTLQTHIDQCLACRACEVVCPAGVAYEKLFVHGKTYLAQQKSYHLPLIKRFIHYSLLHPQLIRLGAGALRFAQQFGFARHPKIAKADRLKPFYPAVRSNTGLTDTAKKIALSPGCIHPYVDNQTLKDAILIFNACGHDVYVPQDFICCGALHAHSGEKAVADRLAEKNKLQFAHLQVEAVISTATGCTPSLQNSIVKVFDIATFLINIPWPTAVTFAPLAKKVLLHTPCTLRNALKQAQSPVQLLIKIPELNIHLLQNENCCGGAGTYFLEHKEMAQKLAADILNEVREQQPDIFVTSNIGCAIHLKKQFAKHKLAIEVLHPVNLLARQYRAACSA